jgi:hypothetical protein
MRLGSRLKWLAAVAIVAASTVPAGAQTDGPAPDAQVGFQKKAQLTPAQQVTEAGNQITRMEQTASAIRRQLEEARAERDVVKVLCLNDKLSQADVAIRSAKDRQQSLQLSASRNDAELSNHEFTILTVLRQRGDQLSAEANQCIGEPVAVIGETITTPHIDPTLPPDDDTQYSPTDPGIVSLPPDCTTCTR